MKKQKAAPNAKTSPVKGVPTEPIQASFAEVVSLIERARNRAYQAVNTELIGLYYTSPSPCPGCEALPAGISFA